LKIVTEDESHQGIRRILNVPWPYIRTEVATKGYVDANAGAGGSSGILDGGSPSSDYTDGPIIDCGEIT
jgi:hypothetical protein